MVPHEIQIKADLVVGEENTHRELLQAQSILLLGIFPTRSYYTCATVGLTVSCTEPSRARVGRYNTAPCRRNCGESARPGHKLAIERVECERPDVSLRCEAK